MDRLRPFGEATFKICVELRCSYAKLIWLDSLVDE